MCFLRQFPSSHWSVIRMCEKSFSYPENWFQVLKVSTWTIFNQAEPCGIIDPKVSYLIVIFCENINVFSYHLEVILRTGTQRLCELWESTLQNLLRSNLLPFPFVSHHLGDRKCEPFLFYIPRSIESNQRQTRNIVEFHVIMSTCKSRHVYIYIVNLYSIQNG